MCLEPQLLLLLLPWLLLFVIIVADWVVGWYGIDFAGACWMGRGCGGHWWSLAVVYA
jgi:hypothetical protein